MINVTEFRGKLANILPTPKWTTALVRLLVYVVNGKGTNQESPRRFQPESQPLGTPLPNERVIIDTADKGLAGSSPLRPQITSAPIVRSDGNTIPQMLTKPPVAKGDSERPQVEQI